MRFLRPPSNLINKPSYIHYYGQNTEPDAKNRHDCCQRVPLQIGLMDSWVYCG